MLPISVCMIAKNEEQYIGECLKRLIKYDWEIVVVDTGSCDQTVAIARSYTSNVYDYIWTDDFSEARNYSISKAHNDYIMVVDCDEYLEASPILDETIIKLCSIVSPNQIGMIDRRSPSPTFSTNTIENTPEIIHEHIARFFHKDYVTYRGTIHEQLVPKDGHFLSFISLPICFFHAGYSTDAIKAAKATRNIVLLEHAININESDPYLHFQLGQSYFGIAEYRNALPYFENALSMDVNENEDYVQTLVESYGYCLLYLKQYEKAMQLEGIYDIFSKRADFLFLMGLIYMNNAMFEQAIREFLRATSIDVYAVDGVNSYKAFYNIGVIYECTGDFLKALSYYKKCGNYSSALRRISELTK